ncbi:hypothetical protein NKR23_g1240 [Pleurostoma richardsiae]|uniref:Uncharacterized protein n=1 Tax=Pleurostoma richardsiae TaxID=41990 RepID=A0AA38VKE3_9PEZI|nr:hypothetical protein NKR23_g1240 [Pleurostoma richardsiae]
MRLPFSFVTTFLLLGSGLAWVGDFPRIDLSWPKVGADDLFVSGNVIVNPLETKDDDAFPCALVPIPSNVVRQDFPIFGGAIQLNFTAPDPAQRVNGTTHWIVHLYFGQFNDDMAVNEVSWAYMATYSWNSSQFELGTWCSNQEGDLPMNLTRTIEDRPVLDSLPQGLDLEGVNVTLGLALDRFGGPYGDDPQDEMNQCAYVRLTSRPSSWGPCYPPDTAPTTASSGAATGLATVGTVLPTLTPPGYATPTGTGEVSSHDSHRGLTVGVGAGVASGVACLLIFAVIVLLARRRARAARTVQQMPADSDADDLAACVKKGKEKDVVVGDGKDEKLEILAAKLASAKEKDDGSVAESSSNSSIHSEPLPSYREAVEGSRGNGS